MSGYDVSRAAAPGATHEPGERGEAEASPPSPAAAMSQASEASPVHAQIDVEAPEGTADAFNPLQGGNASVDSVEPDITRSSGEGGEVADSPRGPTLESALEAILLVVDEPVTEVTLAQVLERPRGEIAETLQRLAGVYAAQGRGFDLREVAGGWRFYTRPECASVVERFVLDGQQARLTQAALETLAVVAYRQPVSRARVSAVRGVNVDGVMRTLVTRGLVEESGTDSDSGSILYRTTGYFLERLGLSGIEELPDLAPLLPDLESIAAENDALSS